MKKQSGFGPFDLLLAASGATAEQRAKTLIFYVFSLGVGLVVAVNCQMMLAASPLCVFLLLRVACRRPGMLC